MGYFDGQHISFVHTEASDPQIATHLIRQSGSPVVVVPALADVPESALALVYVFGNGVAPDEEPRGPMGYQSYVFDTTPGDPDHSPLRAVHQVRWSDDAQPRLLRSAAEVTAAAEAGEVDSTSGRGPQYAFGAVAERER